MYVLRDLRATVMHVVCSRYVPYRMCYVAVMHVLCTATVMHVLCMCCVTVMYALCNRYRTYRMCYVCVMYRTVTVTVHVCYCLYSNRYRTVCTVRVIVWGRHMPYRNHTAYMYVLPYVP